MRLFGSLWCSSSSSSEISVGDYFEWEDLRADDVEDSLSSKSNEKFCVSLIFFSILLLVFDVVVHLNMKFFKDFLGEYVEWEYLSEFAVVAPLNVSLYVKDCERMIWKNPLRVSRWEGLRVFFFVWMFLRWFFESLWSGTSSYYESFFKGFLREYVKLEILNEFDVVVHLTTRLIFCMKVSAKIFSRLLIVFDVVDLFDEIFAEDFLQAYFCMRKYETCLIRVV